MVAVVVVSPFIAHAVIHCFHSAKIIILCFIIKFLSIFRNALYTITAILVIGTFWGTCLNTISD